jgi:hypothetical protein
MQMLKCLCELLLSCCTYSPRTKNRNYLSIYLHFGTRYAEVACGFFPRGDFMADVLQMMPALPQAPSAGGPKHSNAPGLGAGGGLSQALIQAKTVAEAPQKGPEAKKSVPILPSAPKTQKTADRVPNQIHEVIAKPQKGQAKPMGQDVHVCHKTNNIAAQAASTIVHCPLSIIHFFPFPGFATGSDKNCRFAAPLMKAGRAMILGNNCPHRWPSSQQMAAAPSFPQNWHEV